MWVGGPPDASFGFYRRKALHSQTNTGKILYNKIRYVIGTEKQQLHNISH